MPTPSFRARCWFLGYALLSIAAPAFGQTYRLDEPATDSRVFRVRQSMKLTGTLSTPVAADKAIPLIMAAKAEQSFRARRIPGLGRNARAYRSLRYYDKAEMRVTVNKAKSRNRLSSTARTIVAQGGDGGLMLYSPHGPITHSDRDLLAMPGDSLALMAFLPPGPAKIGQSWTPGSWAVQMLAGIDAVAKSTVICKLTSADRNAATISLAGQVDGARDGAPTTIALDGEFTYNRKRGHISALKLKQSEKSRSGPVSPALDVIAEITMQREVTEDAGPLASRVAGRLSLEPKDELLKLRFDASDDVRVVVDRNWHVVFHKKGVAILRLLDEGNLVAQVNVRSLPTAQSGERVSEKQFQRDIAVSLGGRLKKVVKAEQIKPKTKTADSRYLYRVTVEGKDNGIVMQWRYYLCAAPSGKQVSLVFAVEKKLVEQFADRDIGFVLGLRFTGGK
ncbi:MAG: hypothetical protein ACE5KM_07285 [Planctomycetaceae bacterium]